MTPDEILVLLLIKHKHSHFCPKATGLRDFSSSLGESLQTWTMSYMCAWVCDNIQTGQTCLCQPLSVPSVFASCFIWLLSLSTVSVLSVQWESHCGRLASLSLTARGTAREEVSSHLSLPLHLDNTSTVQLISVVDQHVVQVCGHLREDTDIWHQECETFNPSQEKLCQS